MLCIRKFPTWITVFRFISFIRCRVRDSEVAKRVLWNADMNTPMYGTEFPCGTAERVLVCGLIPKKAFGFVWVLCELSPSAAFSEFLLLSANRTRSPSSGWFGHQEGRCWWRSQWCRRSRASLMQVFVVCSLCCWFIPEADWPCRLLWIYMVLLCVFSSVVCWLRCRGRTLEILLKCMGSVFSCV